MKLNPNTSVLIVLDPQKGFTDPQGTIAKHFGAEELEEIESTTEKLNTFIKSLDKKQKVLFIKSEYKEGQFTNGDLNNPLANLCVKGANNDCDWMEGIEIPKNADIITKHHTDASTEGDYLNYLEYRLGEIYTELYFAGFMTSTCIKQTILSTENFFHTKFKYHLLKDLSASRSSYYKDRLTQIYDSLKEVGVEII